MGSCTKGATGSFSVHKRRRWRYFRKLQDQGFDVDNDAYKYFAADVFHDGEIVLCPETLLSGRVRISAVNISAMDRVSEIMGKNAMQRISREDFKTRVDFLGVSRFTLHLRPGNTAIYDRSLLTKTSTGQRLIILFSDKARMSARGRMDIVFRECRVENICRKIRQYVGRRATLSSLIGCLERPPEYYAWMWNEKLCVPLVRCKRASRRSPPCSP